MSHAELTQVASLGFSAFLVGLSGAMSPGSYLTVTVARTLRDGWVSAELMLLGHALLEGALLVGFAFGLQNLLVRPSVSTALAFIGGAVLLWMGWGLGRGAVSGAISADLDAPEQAASRRGAVLDGALVSISNPYWTLWWATIGVKLAADGLAIGPAGVAAFFIGHLTADVLWYTFVITAVHRGRHLLSPKVYRIVMGGLALFLVVLGGGFVLEGLGRLN